MLNDFKKTKIYQYFLPFAAVFLAAVLAIGVFSDSKKVDAAWYSTSGIWSYRKLITVDHQKVATTSSLTNFPMLFSVTDPDLKFTGSGGKVASSTGLELVFTSADGTTALDYEIEYYSSTTGQLIAWVRIPTLSGVTDTNLFLYFGGDATAINTDHSNRTGVWDSNYKGVWHLPDGTTLTANDSTSNANNGTLQNSPTATTGKIDGGVNLASASSQYITAPALGTDFGTNFTVSGWIKRDGTQQAAGSLIADQFAGYVGHAIFWGDPTNGLNSNRLYGGFYDGTAWRYAGMTSDTSDLTWVYAVLTYDGSTIKLYIDGAAPFTSSFSGYTRISGLGTNIGKRWDSGNYVNGTIDEVRYSEATRSVDWIATEYNNQSSPGTFYSYGWLDNRIRSSSSSNNKLISSNNSNAWYSTSGIWSYRKLITVDHQKVATTSALTNFPMLFSVTDPDLKFTGSGGKVASSTGLELVFTSADGTTALDYEIEYYSSTTGQLIAWVRVPTLSGVTDTNLYLYFGGDATAINTDHSNRTGVWDSNYKGVWHLAATTGTSLIDSTSNANNGSRLATNEPYPTLGKIDGAQDFDGVNDYINVPSSSTLDTSSAQTVSLWLKASSTPQNNFAALMNRRNSLAPPYNNWVLDTGSAGNTYEYCVTNNAGGGPSFGQWCLTNGSLDLNWHYLVGTYDGVTQRMYLDGVLVNSQSLSITIDNDALPVRIGTPTGSDTFFKGDLDDPRVSDSARPLSWITTEYRNQASPGTFYSYGGLMNRNGRVNSPGILVPAVKTRGGVKFR